MNRQGFNNVKGQIGFCGIWCGSCVIGNGVLRELTCRYEAIIENYDLAKWAPEDFNFKEFAKALNSIRNMPICPGCLKGGGRDHCEMRICATRKKVAGCSECSEANRCKHTELHNSMQTGALKAGLFVKKESGDDKKFIPEWSSQLKDKWPCSILFSDEPD